MSEKPPQVGLSNRAFLEKAAGDAVQPTSHLWFLTDEPHAYDRGQEAMVRAAREKTFGFFDQVMALRPDEVGYYRNPRERLRKMHSRRAGVTQRRDPADRLVGPTRPAS